MKRRVFFLIGIAAVLLLGVILISWQLWPKTTRNEATNTVSVLALPKVDTKKNVAPPEPRAPEKLLVKTVNHAVPFTSQSPLREWSDKRQQDACEEASVYMAMLWVQRTSAPTPSQAKQKILDIYAYEQKNFGNGFDTNATDTVQHIVKGYFGYNHATVVFHVTLEDIVQEIMKGNVVLTPMNGQALKNPYFTAPGPERHMVLIRGYDAVTHEIITNDPGTIHGEGYRYNKKLFFNAIREYESGDHAPIMGTKKTMIVITP